MAGEESTASSGDVLDRIIAASEEPLEAVQEETPQETVADEGHATEEDEVQTQEEHESDEEQPEAEDRDQEDDSDEEETAASEDDISELAPEEFAELLGIDSDLLEVSDDGEVLLRTKVGEEQESVPLKALIKSYQTDKYVTQKSQAVSEEIKAFEAEKVHYINEVTERLNDTAHLAQVFEQQLVSDYNNIDWNGLKTSDPGRYAALRQDFTDKQNALNSAKAQLGQQAQKVAQEQEQMAAAQHNEQLAREHEAVLSHIPEWNDAEVAKTEKAAIASFMKENYNFTDDDLMGITDHRALLIVRDAMKARNGEKKVTAAEKKVRKLPKISRPGKNKRPKNVQAEATKKRRVQLRKTGKPRDAAALLMDRL